MPDILTSLTLDAPRTVAWPDWADTTRVDDALAEQAYEHASPACRTALKAGLALTHVHFGESSGFCHEQRRETQAGFWRHSASFPAPWALIAFTPGYTAAARLMAAAAPALLAGVPLVGAACVGGKPSPEALVALELCGVEDIFILDEVSLSAFLEESRPGPGRLVLLHTGELDHAAHAARVLGVPYREERRAPALILSDPEAFDIAVLRFAQGQALDAALEPARPIIPEALYLKPGGARGHCKAPKHGPFRFSASIALAPGCEGFWLHQEITPEFFRVTRRAFGPLE